MAADARARLALADAVADIGTTVSEGLQHTQEAQAATEAAVEQLWSRVVDREQELTEAVEQLVQVCVSLAERIESVQLDRRALADAMTLLARQSLPPPSPSPPTQDRVVGGSVFGTPALESNGSSDEGIREPGGWHVTP